MRNMPHLIGISLNGVVFLLKAVTQLCFWRSPWLAHCQPQQMFPATMSMNGFAKMIPFPFT